MKKFKGHASLSNLNIRISQPNYRPTDQQSTAPSPTASSSYVESSFKKVPFVALSYNIENMIP